ncbi:hypothetical protein, partial [Parazoarcus communis]|uniref:hypothetical protein n=1 Tax=Parazoarcus communis TaxID=41977 RepID=UPI001459B434
GDFYDCEPLSTNELENLLKNANVGASTVATGGVASTSVALGLVSRGGGVIGLMSLVALVADGVIGRGADASDLAACSARLGRIDGMAGAVWLVGVLAAGVGVVDCGLASVASFCAGVSGVLVGAFGVLAAAGA